MHSLRCILPVVDGAATPQPLDLPGYRLHPFKGGLKGFWSVTVRANWRIIFRFQGEDAFDVELIDYHERAWKGANIMPMNTRLTRNAL